MLKYEVIGMAYSPDGGQYKYFESYKSFDKPAEALLFAHAIDSTWLKENGNLPEDVNNVEIFVDLFDEDGVAQGDKALYHEQISIYHRTNFGVQPEQAVV